jgi:hypothetical protein
VLLDAPDGGKQTALRYNLADQTDLCNRRPSDEELVTLMLYFSTLYERNKRCAPMHLFMTFAISDVTVSLNLHVSVGTGLMKIKG